MPINKIKLSEAWFQYRLFWHVRGASDYIFLNHHVCGYYEVDFARVLKSHRWYEYEIKLSVADFRADAEKRENPGGPTKHELLAGNIGGPNRFYYVMPADVADKVEIPQWAGLIVWDLWLVQRKPAPLRHDGRVSNSFILNGLRSAMWRFADDRLSKVRLEADCQPNEAAK